MIQQYPYRTRKRRKLYSKKEFLIVALFVLSCGNPWIQQLEGKFFWVFFAMLSVFYYFLHKKRFDKTKSLYLYMGVTLGIFAAQYFIFGWNTFPGIVNFECKLISGAAIYMYFRERFKYVYLNLLYYLSIIALFFWILQLNGIWFDWFPVKGFEDYTGSGGQVP